MKKLFFVLIMVLSLRADTLTDANKLISEAASIDSSINLNMLNIDTLQNFEKELNMLANTQINNDNVTEVLNAYLKLSQECFQLAYDMTNIIDKNSENFSNDYITTLVILTQTTLRLSDDIGDMADRIGEMADRIGVMADRILYTEDLIVKYSQMLNETAKYIIDKIQTP